MCWGYTGGAGLCGGGLWVQTSIAAMCSPKKKGHKAAGIPPRSGTQTPERLLMLSERLPGETFQVRGMSSGEETLRFVSCKRM